MSSDHLQSAERPSRQCRSHPFLELLAAGRVRRGVRAAGAARPRRGRGRPSGSPRLERAKLLALRVRAELEGRRRREAELSALFETAHDLAGLRDLDAVLQAIVQRARSLLGTEVAYLSLNDPARGRHLYAGHRRLGRRPASSSCGSAWARGSAGWSPRPPAPMSPTDYFNDDRFQHTRTIDAGVQDEGLVAILGVPLMLGSQRHRRAVRRGPPRPGLRTRADRAARLLRRARRRRHRHRQPARRDPLGPRRTGAGQRDHPGPQRRHRARLRRPRPARPNWCCAAAGCTTWPPRSPKSSTARSSSPRPPAPAEALEPSRADGHAVRHGDDWIAAVAAGGELLGALVLRGHPGLDPVDQRTLERAAMVTSLLLLARRSAAEAEQRVRGELLDDLLDAARPRPAAAARTRGPAATPTSTPPSRAGRPARRPRPRPDADQEADRDRQRLWSAASHLAATRHGPGRRPRRRHRPAAAARPRRQRHRPGPPRPPGTWAQRVHDAGHRRRLRPGRRDLAARPDAVAAAYAEARRCLDALRLLGRAGDGAAAEDFGFLGLLLADDRRHRRLRRPHHRRRSSTYDERRGTELVRTLDAYFACGMSPARTKDELHVHVNTVAQRLERVGRLLGADWQTPGPRPGDPTGAAAAPVVGGRGHALTPRAAARTYAGPCGLPRSASDLGRSGRVTHGPGRAPRAPSSGPASALGHVGQVPVAGLLGRRRPRPPSAGPRR